MADEETAPAPVEVDVEQEDENYQPPPAKSIDELLQSDKDDEALQKYKAALLGSAVAGSGAVVVDPADKRSVILKKLSLVSEGREDATIDLTDDLAKIKTKTFVIKEGVKFRIKIDFIVQREIVHGLKYVQKTYRLVMIRQREEEDELLRVEIARRDEILNQVRTMEERRRILAEQRENDFTPCGTLPPCYFQTTLWLTRRHVCGYQVATFDKEVANFDKLPRNCLSHTGPLPD